MDRQTEMHGVKRKATRPSPYEIPSKLQKHNTSSNVGRQLSLLRRQRTVPKLPMTALKWPRLKRKETKEATTSKLPLPKWPTLKRKKTTKDATEASKKESTETPSFVPPRLRRASTLPLSETESSSSDITSSATTKKSLSKKPSSLVKTLSKSGSTTCILDEDETATTVTKLPSGSSIGKTTSLSKLPSAIKKELSKTSSFVKTMSVENILKEMTVSRLSEKKTTVSKEPSIRKSISSASSPPVKRTSLMRKSTSVKFSQSNDAETDEGLSSAPLLPPGGLMEIVFSFDTTGSMYSCLEEVKGRIQDLIQRLQADIPGIRIAVIAHGDYCDVDNYIVQWIDFGATVPELCDFVKNIKKTGGGDNDECYELVLRRVQNVMTWTPGSRRSLVMIGDASPHEPWYAMNTEKIDWRKECDALKHMGVHIYGVDASTVLLTAKQFYKAISQRTDGQYLKLDKLSDIFNTMMAICYREHGTGLEALQDEIKHEKGGKSGGLNVIFKALRNTTKKRRSSSPARTSPVPAKKGKRSQKQKQICEKLNQ